MVLFCGEPRLQVDLGSPLNISRFVLEHAGAGGENPALNTAAYNIQISSDGVHFTTVVNVTGNQDSITTNDITPTTARYVLLNIITPTQSGAAPASIYELEIFGPLGSPAAGFTLSAAPASATVTAGGTASYTATVAALNGLTGAVTMSASGLPAGATAIFSPATVSGAGSSGLSLLTTGSTPAGTYTITLTGTSGTLQQTSTVTLVVNAAQGGIPASIAAIAGTPQSATVGTTFATALQATVKNASNNPVSGATVTFTAPASGAGAAFAGSRTATVVTNTNGVATAPTLTANGTAGSYAVTASVAGVAAVASFSLTNNPVSANGYGYSRTITIASTQVPNTNQTNFPVLFSSTDPLLMNAANGGHVTNANGYDIIFTADAAGTQKLNHEIESYNGTTGQFIAWVQVPTVSHTTNTVIYLFYGNAGIVTSQENKAGVWNGNYAAVYHLGNGVAVGLNDSTSSGNTLTNHGATAASGEISGEPASTEAALP